MTTMNLDEQKLAAVIQAAFNRASGNRRWETAIAKAKQQFETNPYMSFDTHTLLVLSPSGEIYEANGRCQCRAYRRGFPCWHRAAGRIAQRYFESH